MYFVECTVASIVCPRNRFNLDNDDGNGCESSCNPGNSDECYEDSGGWKNAAGKTITNLVLTSVGDTYSSITDCNGIHATWGNESHGNVVQAKHVYEHIADDLVIVDYGTYHRIQVIFDQETFSASWQTSAYDLRTLFFNKLDRINQFKEVAKQRRTGHANDVNAQYNNPFQQRRERVKASKIMMKKLDLPSVYNLLSQK